MQDHEGRFGDEIIDDIFFLHLNKYIFGGQLLVQWNDGKTPLDVEERNLLSVAYKVRRWKSAMKFVSFFVIYC